VLALCLQIHFQIAVHVGCVRLPFQLDRYMYQMTKCRPLFTESIAARQPILLLFKLKRPAPVDANCRGSSLGSGPSPVADRSVGQTGTNHRVFRTVKRGMLSIFQSLDHNSIRFLRMFLVRRPGTSAARCMTTSSIIIASTTIRASRSIDRIAHSTVYERAAVVNALELYRRVRGSLVVLFNANDYFIRLSRIVHPYSNLGFLLEHRGLKYGLAQHRPHGNLAVGGLQKALERRLIAGVHLARQTEGEFGFSVDIGLTSHGNT
jgi:hypothetical protein